MTLCIWPVAPDPDGDGASQRAWHVLNALADVQPVDLVLLQQTDRPELAAISLQPARSVARTVRFVPVPQWCTTAVLHPRIPNSLGRVLDVPRIGSVETPRLSASALRTLAAQLPDGGDPLFVGRLSTACIVDDLCRMGLMRARCRIVDFDDIMSRFRRLQMRQRGARSGMMNYYWQTYIARRMERAESHVARTWDACTVASGDDVAILADTYPEAHVYHLPNVVDRARLPAPAPINDALRLLFVGNLAYPPNADGVNFLLDQVLPELRRSNPAITLTIVGRAPAPALAARIHEAGVDLHTDVPSVEPFYAAADAVIAPIFFGGGTRVKLLEAMALGKPIVATSFAVEGLSVQHGIHALLGETAGELMSAVHSLAADHTLRTRLADRARQLQRERYGRASVAEAVRHVLAACST